MNQFVILSFGVDPLNWPSFIEIGEIACSTPAWCTHELTLKITPKKKLPCTLNFYSTFRVKVTPKRVKTTHVRSKINPIY